MVKAVVSLAICALAYANTDEASLLQARKTTAHSPVAPLIELPGTKTCVVSGDPHIKPFDNNEQTEMCLGPMSDYWLVNTPELWIQARYVGRKRNDGYAFVKGLVMGGSRLGGKKLTIPVENAGKIIHGGTVLEEWGTITGAGYTIEHAAGPRVATWVESPGINSKAVKNSIWVRFQDTNGNEDVRIVVNQGSIQNVLIIGGKQNFGTSTGQCGNINDDPTDDTIDVDDCPGKVPCNECEFGVNCPNPECDMPREPECCEGRQMMFYRNICDGAFPKSTRKSEWTVWNCLTDCCADRQNCPDQDNDGEKGSCIIRGDPHIKTFDSGTLDKHVFGPLGDYWLVNNHFFKIQGRYGSHREDKKASLQGVFLSGAMMGGMNMYIGRDTIQINGQNIYTPLDNEHFNITDHMGENIRFRMDPVKDKPKVPVITVFFKGLDNNIVATLKVNKAFNAKKNRNQAMFFEAESWLLKDVSGQCGNFNGDKTDDDGVMADYLRDGAGSMFTSRNPQNGLSITAGKCNKKARNAAHQCCRGVHRGAAKEIVNNCVLDNCGGKDPANDCKAGALESKVLVKGVKGPIKFTATAGQRKAKRAARQAAKVARNVQARADRKAKREARKAAKVARKVAAREVKVARREARRSARSAAKWANNAAVAESRKGNRKARKEAKTKRKAQKNGDRTMKRRARKEAKVARKIKARADKKAKIEARVATREARNAAKQA